jgi:arsenate reductase-like glutaredoxin family protein
MLTIFRKVRKAFLSSGQTQRYFLYAIGEIALVVIGILIALQINNWNEDRIGKATEIQVLKRLLIDIEVDHRHFTEVQQDYLTQYEALLKAERLIYTENLSDEEMDTLIQYESVQFNEIIPKRNTYDEMINSGKIYNLSNESLLESITAYYSTIDALIYETRQDRDEFRAIFYGPNLIADYWPIFHDQQVKPGHKQDKNLLRAFFNNKNSTAYKTLKTSASWGTNIAQIYGEELTKELIDINITLSKALEHEIAKLSSH